MTPLCMQVRSFGGEKRQMSVFASQVKRPNSNISMCITCYLEILLPHLRSWHMFVLEIAGSCLSG